MDVPGELFDEDYSYFYTDILNAARSDADADVVARLLAVHAGMSTTRCWPGLPERCDPGEGWLVPAPQLVPRLKRAGFSDVQLFGRDGGRFEPEGPRLIALARR